MLENVGIKSYIDKQLKKIEDKRIAKAEEVLEHLTSAMRGEIKEDKDNLTNLRDLTKD